MGIYIYISISFIKVKYKKKLNGLLYLKQMIGVSESLK